MKITRIRYYADPGSRPIFNQSSNLVTVETDQGITGIGEGGSRDTIVQCAAMLIGEDPGRIEHLWQLMYGSTAQRSPGLTFVRPSPTASTSMPSSWPGIRG